MVTHDVLVVGAGLAGLRAAIEARQRGVDAAVISKVHPVRSHSTAAQGGINAAMGGGVDSWEAHAFDTVKGSDYLGDQDAIEICCREAPEEIIRLEHMGVIFNRDETGHLGTRAFGGASYARTFFVADITGQALLHVMYEQILKLGVKVYEEWFVTSLMMEEGVCSGVVALNIFNGDVQAIRAKATILATGGLGRVYEPSTNGLICTGDGMALAYRAGAPLMDMEMVQYHPTTLKNGVLITEGARGEGAYLVNAEGERFLTRYAPQKMELAARDVISRAEQTEIGEGRGVDGCVLLDCRHLGEEVVRTKLSQIYDLGHDFANVDMTREPIPVRPGMHYQMGGIKTDVDGRTSVPGLLAAGECACISLHGANRLGANSLLETVVFGRRAGRAAAEYASAVASKKIPGTRVTEDEAMIKDIISRADDGERPATLRLEMGLAMHDDVGVFRHRDGLTRTIEKIKELKDRYRTLPIHDKGNVFNWDLLSHLELGFMLDCAETIAAGALMREESRGAHYRVDFPQRDDANWLKHTLAFYTPDGPRIDSVPVTITRWQPQARVY